MEEQKYCKNCAGANPPDAQFCATCGAAFVSTAAPPSDTAPSGGPPAWQLPSILPPELLRRFKKRYVLYVFVILIVLAVVASAIWQPWRTPDYVALNVNSLTTSSQLGSYPLPGNTYVVFDVTLINQNKDNMYLGNPLYFTLKTSDGVVYQYYSSSNWLDNPLTGVSNTNPGDKVTGQIAFEIPQSATPSELTYSDGINGVVTTNLSGVPSPSGASASAKPSADYSSYFTTDFENGNSTVTQPFTKSTNERGDDVYTGITRNPSGTPWTTIVELTKSQTDAKQLYDQTVAQKQSEGFVLRSDWVATAKAQNPSITEVWEGQQYSSGLGCYAEYEYDSHVASWLFVTEASG